MSGYFAGLEEKNKEGNGESSVSKEMAQIPGLSEYSNLSKWLMWYLLNILETSKQQIKETNKCDNLVLKYEKVIDGNKQDRFLIMESKFKTANNRKITCKDIVTDKDVPFGLVKCFESFVKLKNAKTFSNGVIEHVLIYTNARFNLNETIPEKDQNWKKLKKIGSIVEEMKLKLDDALSTFKIKGGQFYQFKSDLIFPVLKSMILDYKYYEIAQKLVNALKNEKQSLSIEDKILKHYNHLLLTEVIDEESKMFRDDFLNENCNDVENATGRQRLRRALHKVLKDQKLSVDYINKKAFTWEESFGKPEQTMQIWPNIDADLKEFFKKFVFATEQPDETKLGKIILDDLHKQFYTYDIGFIYSHFYAGIQEWMDSGHCFFDISENISKSRLISFEEANNFFENIKWKFDKTTLKESVSDYDQHNQKLEEDMQHYHIDRAFMRRVENDINVYLIFGINEADLCSEYQHFEIIMKYKSLTQNEISTFYRVVKENKSKCVYLIRKESNEFIVLKKSKDMFDESDFRNAMKHENNKYVINLIASKAGTGKSTLFAKLSQKIKDQNPKIWVINIDLIDVSLKFNKSKNSNRDIKFETIVDLLYHSTNHQNDLEKTIFEYQLQSKNIVLLLDGFDKISSNHKSIILKMIKDNSSIKIDTIWISTRPYISILKDMKKTFVNFHVKHYNFVPLTEDNQRDFLKKIWQQSVRVDESFFTVFFYFFINNMKKEFLEVPLHIILIAIMFKDTFVECQNAGNVKIRIEQRQKLLEIFNLSSLYDKFISFKFEFYCKNNSSLNLDTDAGKYMLSESYRSCLVKSEILALDSLMDENKLKILLTKTELKELKVYKDEIKEKGDAFGIVDQIVNGKPQFIHRTFAEYFVAMFFVDHLKREEKKSQEIVKCFLKNMIKDKNFMICNFIDNKLNDVPNFMEYSDKYGDVVMKMDGKKLYFVLEKRWQNIGEILINNGIYMNYEDCGETIFHSASKLERLNDKKPILSLIFKKSNYKKKELKSKLLTRGNYQRTPLLLAIICGRLENVKIIFEMCKQMEILNDILTDETEQGDNIMHLAVKSKCNDDFFTKLLNLLKSELGNLKTLLTKKNNFGYTPFNKAVFHGQHKRFKTMLNLCDELNISTDSVLFISNTKWDENILHLASNHDCNDDFFIYLLNLLKSKPEELRTLLFKMNRAKQTPLDKAVINGQGNKLEAMLNFCGKLNISTDSTLFINKTKQGGNIIHLAVNFTSDYDSVIHQLNLLKIKPCKLEDLLSKKNNENQTPFDVAMKHGKWDKFEGMWNLCGKRRIPIDSFLFNLNKRGENIIHIALNRDCHDDFFTKLLNLLKSEPDKLKTLLFEKNCAKQTPFDAAEIHNNKRKLETLNKVWLELDRVSTNSGQQAKSEPLPVSDPACRSKKKNLALELLNEYLEDD